MIRKLVVVIACALTSVAHASAPRPGDMVGSGAVSREARILQAAEQFGVSEALVRGVADGLERLYERRYKECRAHFAALGKAHPGTGVTPVADLLVWQAVMLENFDFRYDDQYRAASKRARDELDAAMKTPGAEGWEHLMMTVVAGIESIHAARQGRYLPALTLAFEAVDHVERTRARAPDFLDLRLADGMYNYWRTVVSQKVKGMPDFGDKKAEGIAQMQQVVRDGVFLRPAARLAMAFTWMEEREHDKAVGELAANREHYPDNVINELMLGIARVYARDYAGAHQAFERVLAIDPSNRRVLYYRGMTWQKSGDHGRAEQALRAYLGFDFLEAYQIAAAQYRLGEVLYAQERHGDAVAAYEAAVKADGHASAKAALDRMRKLKKAGTISF